MIRIPSFAAMLLFVIHNQCHAMIGVGTLSKEQARGYGITMHHRKNGDAGVKVWLEFKKEGFLADLSYCELRVNDVTGKRLFSARLQPGPVAHGQPEEIISVAFSASPQKLENCAFMIVAYGSSHGDVGYLLNVKDFLDTRKFTRIEYLVDQHNRLCRTGKYDKAAEVANLASRLYPEHGAASALVRKSDFIREFGGTKVSSASDGDKLMTRFHRYQRMKQHLKHADAAVGERAPVH